MEWKTTESVSKYFLRSSKSSASLVVLLSHLLVKHISPGKVKGVDKEKTFMVE